VEVKKYKILMISQAFPPYEFSEAIVNAKLCLALMKAGHTVHVISRISDQYYSKEGSDLWAPLKTHTYYVEEPPVGVMQRYWELIQGALYFKSKMEGVRWAYKAVKLGLSLHQLHSYDLILSRMPANISHLVSVKIKELTGIPLIANWNDPTSNIRPLMENTNLLQSWSLNRFVRKIFHAADLNTFPSDRLWQHFNQRILHSKSNKVRIIPHIGIDGMGQERRNDPEGVVRICHAGNMLANVKASKLMGALAKIKQKDGISFRFDVFGVIDPEMPDLIAQLGLDEEVHCLPPKNYGEMLRSLSNYDYLLVLEADYEIGILMLSKTSDYVSVQRPIIAISPKEGVLADYLNQYGGGILLDNRDENKVYEGLRALFSKEIEVHASPQLQRALSPATIVGIYEEIFESLTGNKK
jgi:glycosyltransferase involved in cell wall biosynthesis